jgi:hypothetical protein
VADERLRIVIEALNKAEAELKDLQNDLEGIESRGGSASTGLSKADKSARLLQRGLQTLIAGGLTRTVFSLGELGAEALRTESSFGRIVGSGHEAEMMMDQLQAATLYARSEAELMEGATNLLALGLADSAQGIADITRNVEALGGRFGGTMQQFQIMMSNNSLARIDSFGIGVEEATERIEKLKAAGMDADEAFDTAILELMTEKYTQLNGTVEDNLTKVQQGRAAWADLKAELGIGLAGAVGETAGLFAKLTRRVADSTEAVRKLEETQDRATQSAAYFNSTYRSRNDLMLRLAGVDDMYSGTLQDLINLERGRNAATERAAGLARRFAEQQGDVADSAGNSATAFGQYNDALQNGVGPTEAMIDLQDRLAEKTLAARDGFLDAASAIGEMSAAQFAADQIDQLEQAVEDGTITYEGYISAKEKLLRQFGLLTPAEAEAQTKTEELTQQFLDGKISLEGYSAGLLAIKGGLDEIKTGVDNLTLAEAQAQQAVEDVGTSLETTSKQYTDNAVKAENLAVTTSDLGVTGEAAMGAVGESISRTGDLMHEFSGGAIPGALVSMKTYGSDGAAAADDVTGSLRNTRSELQGIPADAAAAQAAIDSIEGKDVYIDLRFREHRAVGTPGESQRDHIDDINSATGFQGWATDPTRFMVAEGGEPEYVTVTPASQMRRYDYSRHVNMGGITINTPQSVQSTLRMLSEMEF